MRLLFATSQVCHPSDICLAERQLLCGPFQADRRIGERIYSLNTGTSDYDLGALISALPEAEQPEVIACFVDGATRAFPRRLPATNAPKILLLGNPLLLPGGMRRILDYVRSEPFDRVVMVEDSIDQPFLAAAGVQNLSWYPGLLSPVEEAGIEFIRSNQRTARISLQKPDWSRHSAGNLLFAALSGLGQPYLTLSEDADFALECLGQNSCAALVSDFGEVPPNLFQALAAGAAVCTLSNPSAGRLATVLAEAGALHLSSCIEELAKDASALLVDVKGTHSFSRNAVAWYDTHLSQMQRQRGFLKLVTTGVGHQDFELPGQSQTLDSADLSTAVNFLPVLQECALTSRKPIAFLHPTSPYGLRLAAARLPRLKIGDQPTLGLGESFCFFAGSARAPYTAVTGSPVCAWVPPSTAALLLGYARAAGLPGLVFKPQYRAELDLRKAAWDCMHLADFDGAQALAQRLMAEYPKSPDGFLIAADLAAEKNDDPTLNKLAAQIRDIDPLDARLITLVQRKLQGGSDILVRQLQATWSKVQAGLLEDAGKYVGFILERSTGTQAHLISEVCYIGAWIHQLHGRVKEAGTLLTEQAFHNPNRSSAWFDLGLQLQSLGDTSGSLHALRRATEQDPSKTIFAEAFNHVRAQAPEILLPGSERDLLITGAESNQKHGAGVLLRRCFSDSRELITVRMKTCFRGVEQVGSINLVSAPLPDSEVQLHNRLRRLLAPFKVRRIICIPFERAEFYHAIAAKSVTSAALCTYVMDDRNIYSSTIEDALVRRLLDASELKLAISTEMQLTYGFKFRTVFELLPPLVSSPRLRRENRWTPKKRPGNHCAFVGNLWSQGQYSQLVTFFARTGLKADWFGREGTPDLEKAGIFGQGFIPEDELADRLTSYPFVVVPSGELTGTEDNEWLTRLSFPSRIVFLLQCGIPMLVVGSQDTCAGQVVRRLDVGRTVSSTHPNPQRIVQEFTDPLTRKRFLHNINIAAPAFLMPDAGAWIWKSLEAGTALPAPFHSVLPRNAQLETLWPAA